MKRLFRFYFLLFFLFPALCFSAEPGANKIKTNTSAFNNNLNANDTTVQKALDTIDNLSISAAGSGNHTIQNNSVAVSSYNTTNFIAGSGITLAIADATNRTNVTITSSAGGGNISGSGANTQIPYFTAANTIASEAAFTYNATTNSMAVDNLTLTTPLADASVADTITLTNITQITTRSHTLLTDIGTNTHAQIDTHLAAANPHSDSLNKTLTSANIYVGNATNVATGVAMSGDVAINNTGATTIQGNSVALGTDTTGNYAAGDAEAGAALTGDNATAFFTLGNIEIARGGTGAGSLDNLIALTANTTGNYVASMATTAPLTGGAGGSEGAALTFAISKGNSTVDGYINATDWGTFNGKQAAGDYITALTGAVTATGPGSVATTLAANIVNGTNIALGSDAQGDVMFYDGTNWVRLGAGPVAGYFLQTNGAGANVTWNASAGSGDITSVGDVASGAAFDGTQGTTITFNNAGGDKTLDYDGTDFLFNAPLSVDASDGADAGAIRLDNAENIAWEASPAGTDMTLGVDASEILQYSGSFNATALTENGNAIYNSAEVPGGSLGGTWASPTIDDLFLLNDGDIGTGVYDFGGATSFEIPNAASPTVDAAGEIAVDTTDDQVVYYGAAARVVPYHWGRSGFIANLTSSDTQTVSLGGFPYNCTIIGVACQYQGTSAPATVANITLANSNGTLMTHGAVTCSNQTTASTWVAITANNTIAKGLNVFFNVTNTPTVNYNYTISYDYTIDRQ